MKTLSALAASAVLCGCAAVNSLGGGYAKAYEGPELKDAEVAILYTPKPVGNPMAFVAKVDEQVVGDDMLRGYPMVTKVLPGDHRIYVKCNMNTHYAFTTLALRFQPGHYYELSCVNTGTGKASMTITDRGTENTLPK